MLIYFPNMIEANWSAEKVDSALFFDPGLNDDQVEHTFRPENLPLEPKIAKQALMELQGFGEQFRDGLELATYKTGFDSPKSKETAGSIRSQLMKRLAGSSKVEEGDAHLVSSQMTLLLAYSMDQRIGELAELDKGVGETWNRFDTSLGAEDDGGIDAETKNLSRAVADLNAPDSVKNLPWKTVLPALAAFLPSGVTLLVADKDAADFWRENDLLSEKAVEEHYKKVFGPVLGAREKVWKLIGFSRCPVESRWLEKEISVIILGC